MIDNLDDINILSEQKCLHNDYIFIVAYRNQKDKISRCLESIITDPTKYSFGIIIIDDASDDDSIKYAEDSVKRIGCDYVLVKNLDRKYYTRNLYNAVNLLCTNQHSVIIELDGDDYLNTEYDAIEILHGVYNNTSIEKTFGSMISLNPNFNTPRNFNTNYPWDVYQFTSWYPIRTFKKHLFNRIPIKYFKERDSEEWLKMLEDEILHRKMIELCGPDRVQYITTPMYVYDNLNDYHGFNDQFTTNMYAVFKLPVDLNYRDYDVLRLRYKSYEHFQELETVRKNNMEYRTKLLQAASGLTPPEKSMLRSELIKLCINNRTGNEL